MTPSPSPHAYADVVARLNEDIDALNDEVVSRTWAELPSYQHVPRADLERSIARNVRMAIRALEQRRRPSASEMDGTQLTAEERFLAGVPIEDYLRSFQFCIAAMHARFISLCLGTQVPAADATEGSTVLWSVGDAYIARAVSVYHSLQLDAERQEGQRRLAVVSALLTQDAPVDTEALDVALNPYEQYAVVYGPVPPGRQHEDVRGEIEKGGSLPRARALVAIDQGHLVGLVAQEPDPVDFLLGIGHFTPLEKIPDSFAVARKALATGKLLGRTGLQGLPQLGWRLGASDHPVTTEYFIARYVTPLRSDHTGREVLATVQAYLNQGLSYPATAAALDVHVNTVRYRVRRFEEATGCDLRDVDQLFAARWGIEFSGFGA